MINGYVNKSRLLEEVTYDETIKKEYVEWSKIAAIIPDDVVTAEKYDELKADFRALQKEYAYLYGLYAGTRAKMKESKYD